MLARPYAATGRRRLCQLWRALLLIPLLLQGAAGAEAAVMHIGTLLQISGQHPLVVRVGQAYHNLGLQMQLEPMPLERLRLEAVRGELIDGNLAAAATLAQQIPQLLQIPVPIYQLELTAYVSDSRISPRHWADLRGLRVACIAGMLSVEDRLKRHQVQQQVPALTLEQALLYVAKGRVDVAVLPKAEADHVLRQMAEIKVQAVLPVLEQLPLYHYIHQKHQALVGPLTAQFEQLRDPVTGIGNQQ